MSEDTKLTLLGIGGAVVQGGGALLSQGNLDWKSYLGMFLSVALGWFGKTYTRA